MRSAPSPANLNLWRQLCDESGAPPPSSQSSGPGSGNLGGESFDPLSGGDRGDMGGAGISMEAAAAAAAKLEEAAKTWDPHKEIASLAKDLSGEVNKLVLLEPIGQGGFGTGELLYKIQIPPLTSAVRF